MKTEKEGMRKLKASFANIALFLSIFSGMSLVLITLIAPIASAATITVPVDYPTIGEAIFYANPGDTVRVWAGVYEERITVDKTLTLQGNGSSDTTIDAQSLGTVITVSASWVNVTGFTQFGLLSGLL